MTKCNWLWPVCDHRSNFHNPSTFVRISLHPYLRPLSFPSLLSVLFYQPETPFQVLCLQIVIILLSWDNLLPLQQALSRTFQPWTPPLKPQGELSPVLGCWERLVHLSGTSFSMSSRSSSHSDLLNWKEGRATCGTESSSFPSFPTWLLCYQFIHPGNQILISTLVLLSLPTFENAVLYF